MNLLLPDLDETLGNDRRGHLNSYADHCAAADSDLSPRR
jgi:hypothetical protein